MKNNSYGDGFRRKRLFLNSLTEKGLDVKNHYFVKYNVCIIETKAGVYVLKGFSRKEECLEQLKLSRWYSEQPDPMMGIYTAFPTGRKTHFYDNMYWGIMPFYKGDELDLNDEKDVRDGIHAIRSFHRQSIFQSDSYLSLLSSYSLFEKWTKRFNAFKRNSKKHYVSEEMSKAFQEMIGWGKWSLNHLNRKELERMELQARQKGEVCHGDVAPHNFMRLKGDKVILIDYDLFSIVPHDYDILQYVNRIMPYWDWSPSILRKCEDPELEALLRKKWFLIALVFPTDLYREWNRAFEAGKEQIKEMTTFTEEDLPFRRKFIKAVQEKLVMYPR
ncbi:phosphotransferase [Fictibacillus sp. NRS-1165]|uniref:phosphotransferase n=1 Tax=Fictibacillus sp. NRS-1165 TaxID=3144463 RepID=UPI003D23350F